MLSKGEIGYYDAQLCAMKQRERNKLHIGHHERYMRVYI